MTLLQWQKDRDAKQLHELKVFWKTIVQHDPNAKDGIGVTKQGTLWGKVKRGSEENPIWRRYDLIPSQDMSPYVINHGVQCKDNSLYFDGKSYIRIADPGLAAFTKTWGIEEELKGHSKGIERQILSNNQSLQSMLILGTNIRVEADIKVDGINGKYPIFKRLSKYKDFWKTFSDELEDLLSKNSQESKVLSSATTFDKSMVNYLKITDKNLGTDFSSKPDFLRGNIEAAQKLQSLIQEAMLHNEISLTLSKPNEYQSRLEFSVGTGIYETEIFELLDPGFHLLTAQQDADRYKRYSDAEVHYFELYVDTIQLNEVKNDKPGRTNAQHYFSTGESDVYIGHNPGTEEYFNGYIRMLMFDPNASCLGCVG